MNKTQQLSEYQKILITGGAGFFGFTSYRKVTQRRQRCISGG